jgi:hypothetical protein
MDEADLCLPPKTADRLGMRMSQLVEHVSKKPIPPWTKNLLVEVMVNDEDDEDVEVSRGRWESSPFHPRSRRTPDTRRGDGSSLFVLAFDSADMPQVPYCLVRI